MRCRIFHSRAAVALSVAVAGLLVPAAARAQIAVPAALPAPAAAAPRLPTCNVIADKARFDRPLTRVSRLVAAHQRVKIVALGSSSTFGAGASSQAASYPSRLAEELAWRMPGHDFVVVNRGVNGDEAAEMLARLDRDVLAEKPDLVLWQAGTNALLRDKAVLPQGTVLHQGLARLKASGADIVLIDPQYAPKVIAKPNAEGMVSLIATAAKAEHVCLFQRFAMMRHWYETERLPFEAFISADGLHMNDWSYACLAKWLGAAIAEAATRPVATASAPAAGR
jgi:lysophospholipase L1-like esterase